MINQYLIHGALSVLASSLALALAAQAQGVPLLQSDGDMLAASGAQVPGLPPGIIFGGAATFDNAVIDENGIVLFRARVQDPGSVLVPPLTATNDRAYFMGTDHTSVSLVVRSGDSAAPLPGLTMNTAGNTGLSASPRLSPDGQIFFGVALQGAGVSASNDSAIFAGSVVSPVLLVREGSVAPTGASNLTGPFGTTVGYQGFGLNRNGRFVFNTSLMGGDAVAGMNDVAVMTGQLGIAPLEWVRRKGDTIAVPGGSAVIASIGGSIQQINDAGQILHDCTLSLTAGTAPASPANDRILFIFTPGANTNSQVVREGQAAPGVANATFNVVGNAWPIEVPPNGFTGDGGFMLHANLLSTPPITNDRAVYLAAPSGVLTLGVRHGDVAPGTDGTFHTWNSVNSGMTTSQRFTIASTITGGTVASANNSGIWSGRSGNLRLVVREGDALPQPGGNTMVGTISLSDDTFLPNTVLTNEHNQVLFDSDLRGGNAMAGVNDRVLCVWDENIGLSVVARKGDAVEIAAGVFKQLSSWSIIGFNNNGSSPLAYTLHGVIVLRLSFTDGSGAIAKVRTPNFIIPTLCYGNGSGTTCPCSTGVCPPGSGCPNSLHACGAVLTAGGAPYSEAIAGPSALPPGVDTIRITVADLPLSGTSLLYRGTTHVNAGAGTVFGDGLRCCGGAVVRGGVQFPVAGTVSFGYPHSKVSVITDSRAGQTYCYQVWYRNASQFCTAATFNLTNSAQITWLP